MKKVLLLISILFIFIGCSKKYLTITHDVFVKEQVNAGNTLDTARIGERFEILDTYSYYVKIQTVVRGKTIVGWIYEPLVDQKKLIILGQGATVFSYIQDYKGVGIVGTLYPNTKVKIIDGTKDWYKIKRNKTIGWIYSKYTKK